MSDQKQQLIQIRTRKLSVLLVDARLSARRTPEECAAAVGVSPEEYLKFERAQSAPSLPQIEMLALYLNVPVEHFWGNRSISSLAPDPVQEKERLSLVRNRMIGALLRMARTAANYSLRELSEKTGITEEALQKYEDGARSIPLPELEALASATGSTLEKFYDQHGPVGRWRRRQIASDHFNELPPELQEFVSKPINRPYLELAARLSDLDVAKLRSVAEGLLEITY